MKKKNFYAGIFLTSAAMVLGSTGAVYAAGNTSATGYPQYDEILNRYYNGISQNWGIAEFQDDGLCYVAGYTTDVSKLGYYLKDIDRDGVEELLIGAIDDEYYTGMIYDFYTILNGRLVQVVSSGERDRYYLCKDDKIANEGSGGAMNSSFNYYEYESGKLKKIETVFTDGIYDEQNPWFYTTADSLEDHSTPITEEVGRSIISKYEYAEIPFTSLAELQ